MEKFTKGKLVASKPTGSNGFWYVDDGKGIYKTGSVAVFYSDQAESDANLFAVAGEMYNFIKSLQLDAANSVEQERILAKARGE